MQRCRTRHVCQEEDASPCRWTDTNKGDHERVEVRVRLVARCNQTAYLARTLRDQQSNDKNKDQTTTTHGVRRQT